MILAALALAAQAPAAPWPLPSELAQVGERINVNLTGADAQIQFLEVCAQRRARLEARAGDLRRTYHALLHEAEGLFGARVTPGFATVYPIVPCGRADIARYERLAGIGIAAATRALRGRIAAMPGLWLGPLRLCGGAVAGAVTSETMVGQPAITLSLSSEIQAALHAETAARVGRTLAIRLDGRVIMEPMVHEPIAADLQLSPVTEADAAAISEAVRRPC